MTIDISKIVFCVLYVFSVNLIAVPSYKLPKGFVQCKINDSAFDECIRSGLQSAIPHLVTGIPSLGLFKLDPFRIPSLTIEQGTQLIKLKLSFKDLDIINMRSLIVKKAHYNPVNYSISIDSEALKQIVLEGLYEVNGKVFILPIRGNGKCKITLDNFKFSGTIYTLPMHKYKNIYLETQNVSWKFNTSRLHIQLDNLFNGDKVLGNHMNAFLNENWQELLKEMQPSIEEALSLAFVGITNQFFHRIPLNKIFKD